MSYKLYLSIPNIPGEDTDKGFTNQIAVYSYSLGASNPITVGGTGGGSGKASFSDLSILKMYDKSSPLLLKALALGTNVAPKTGPGMILSLVSAGSTTATPFLTYTFQDVYVTNVQDSGSTGGDDKPTQSVSFAFGIITEVYYPQTSSGAQGSPIKVSFDIETNTLH